MPTDPILDAFTERSGLVRLIIAYRLSEMTKEDVAAAILAALAAETRMRTLGSGRSSQPSTESLVEFLERWLAVVGRRVRRRTMDGYAVIVRRHIVPGLGTIPLGSLTALDVQEWIDGQARRFRPRTVSHQLAVLRTALGYAVKTGLVDRNATTGIDLPRIPHRPPVPLTIEQARTFLEATKGDRLHALYVLALTTGMRQGELLGHVQRAADRHAG